MLEVLACASYINLNACLVTASERPLQSGWKNAGDKVQILNLR